MTELALLGLFVLQGGGGSRVAVESATACPSATEVEARLGALLAPTDESAARERAAISAEGNRLRVRLTAADGTPIGERVLTLDVSCADRANVVAVVIAAWEAQQRPQRVPAPTLPARPPPAAAAPPPAAVVVAVPPPVVAPTSLAIEIAVGPAVTLADGALSPSARLTVGLWGPRLGGRLLLFGMWPQENDLGDGRARWARAGAALELARRFAEGRFQLDLHAGPVLGLVFASGTGFERDMTTAGLSPGLTGGLDGTWTRGRVVVGLGASAFGWTAQRLVTSSEPVGVRALPRVELSLGATAGVRF
ncbi:MAG TPA: hypothetical protein VMU50_16960 [Polyangia bacterium]|nr:hypothetical protein [Polyangia bacterium]